ncbi:succinyldiaminopimelate transaminase [Saxibacter everestensis]|uniref:Succinyldiaminopimelate transaminase n=1 Tax=Saxibacter everestensis TaxID=2909229 RepID=A0ABY8QNL7_9MICO|nr:succinyldiaminopimelate transaminase [Brevibacteriaceae bacterium ZFBP1038]
MATGFGLDLPDYPWESLAPYAARARENANGMVDLSIGTPVDSTPEHIQAALCAAADAPGYPTTAGTPELRAAITDWFARRRNVPDLDPETTVLPTLGSKELVAWLPTLLGMTSGDVVAHPRIAYPTYDMGARIAGATALPIDAVELISGEPGEDTSAVRLLWLNSPGNPTGEVLSLETLAATVRWARANNVVVVSDECYAELAWEDGSGSTPDVPCLLDPRVSGGSLDNLLVAYSLSKQSNLAGYRSSFLAGDPVLIRSLTTSRKHAGMLVPKPVQEATRAALGDNTHVAEQKDRYAARRRSLKPALEAWGLRIDHSEAGLYLWASADEDCWVTIDRLADLGILAGPGIFYGAAGAQHVRFALTGSDERIGEAVSRLTRPTAS